MRKESFRDRPDLIVDWRPFVVPLLVTMLLVLFCSWAFAQDNPEPTPPIAPTERGDKFKELMCRMAIGNVQGGVQERRDLYVDLYGNPEATWKSGGRYGLLTGFYYGDRGSSVHGPTLDDPKRYLEDGTEFTNADAAHLRSIASEFRQGACDKLLPPPEPEPKTSN